ncbi:DUF2721 domain-containing protein [Candidatus Bathyarchaeota archaeon]|nr:DUF2721 domain-containing protein [Candidatus Bathyarchaeota archaeon]
MQADQIIPLLQVTLVPVVMISAVGLICLTVQTRYGRIIDRIRALNEEKRAIKTVLRITDASNPELHRQKERLEFVETILEKLTKRGLYLKWALFLMLSSVFCFIATSFLILMSAIGITQGYLILGLFSIGMICVLVGSLLLSLEVALSYTMTMMEIRT